MENQSPSFTHQAIPYRPVTQEDLDYIWSNYDKLIQPQVPEYPTPGIDMSMYTGEYQNE